MSCAAIDTRVAAYRRETLPESERRELRLHLAGCSACRERALAVDPTMIFALPAPGADDAGRRIADETDARFVLENVKAALAVRAATQKLERSPSIRHGRRAASGLAAAALVALAFSGSGRPRPAAVSDVRASAGSALRDATKIVRPGADESPSMPSSATIYEWNPGTASPQDPKIVWIVDRSLDL